MPARTTSRRTPAAPRSLRGPALALGVTAALGAVVATAGTAAAAPPTPPSTHTVVAGDTLYDLAAANRTTVAALVAANHLPDARSLTPGQRLVIPGAAAPAPAPAAPAPAPAAAPTTTRTVVAGDTVSGVALATGTTTGTLVALNHLPDARHLVVGQRLLVPAPAAPARPPVASTFAGRTYPPEVTASATAHRDALLSRPVPSRAEVQRLVHDTAVDLGVDPSLALAVTSRESGFDMRAVSPADAVGAMQVLPATGRAASALVGRPLDLLDARDNVTAGVAVLRQLLRSAPDEDTAIAGYYQGLAGVQAQGMYPDTVAYVAGVQAGRARFR